MPLSYRCWCFPPQRRPPDVIFLDVEMPGMDGFTLLQQIPNPSFEVIFTTAYSQYAIEALRMSAVDFLTKPIIEAELRKAVERLHHKLAYRKQPQEKVPTASVHALFNKIPVPSLRGISFVPVQDIIRLESDSNYTIFHLLNNRKIVASHTLKEFAELLEPLHFVRIHRSSVINLQYVSEYVRGEGGTVIMIDGSEVEVSRNEKKNFLEKTGWF